MEKQEEMTVSTVKHNKAHNHPRCKTEKETQMYRTDFWTLWEKVRVGAPRKCLRDRLLVRPLPHLLDSRSF